MNLPAAIISHSAPVFSAGKQAGATFETDFWHDLVW